MGLRMSRDASKWKCAPGLETYENNSYGVCRTVAPANGAGWGEIKMWAWLQCKMSLNWENGDTNTCIRPLGCSYCIQQHRDRRNSISSKNFISAFSQFPQSGCLSSYRASLLLCSDALRLHFAGYLKFNFFEFAMPLGYAKTRTFGAGNKCN